MDRMNRVNFRGVMRILVPCSPSRMRLSLMSMCNLMCYKDKIYEKKKLEPHVDNRDVGLPYAGRTDTGRNLNIYYYYIRGTQLHTYI